MMKPLVVWVTRQAELARQPVSASRSKEIVRHGCRIVPAEKSSGKRGGRMAASASRRSGIALALLPLGFEFEDCLPVAALDFGHVRFLRDGGAPSDRVANQGVVLA